MKLPIIYPLFFVVIIAPFSESESMARIGTVKIIGCSESDSVFLDSSFIGIFIDQNEYEVNSGLHVFRIGKISKSITIPPGKTTIVDFSLPIKDVTPHSKLRIIIGTSSAILIGVVFGILYWSPIVDIIRKQ